MSLNYGSFVTDLANLLVVPSSDPNFVTALNDIINDAEGRMYREIDLLETRVTDNSATLASSTKTFALSTNSGTFVVVEEIGVVTPASLTVANGGSLTQLYPVSREFLNAVYPSATTAQGVPEFWANIDNSNIQIGPTPDQAYPVQVIGTIRPTALSSNNSSTVLTQLLPDCFMAAACAFGAAYLKNFGAAQDDPRSGMTWEQVYQDRKKSALDEEFRKRHMSQAWTAKISDPLVQRQ